MKFTASRAPECRESPLRMLRLRQPKPAGCASAVAPTCRSRSQVNDDLLPFFDAQPRPRKLPVVRRHGNDPVGRDLDRRGRNSDGVIGRTLFILRISGRCFGDATMGDGMGH